MMLLTIENQDMNIFVLDGAPHKAARYHCDRHVVKMILESAQILCTVAHKYGLDAPYRATHHNHPCTLWAGESSANWDWLVALSAALNQEYRSRFNHTVDHKSWTVISHLEKPRSFPETTLTPFAQAMPEKYRAATDPVAAYRAFYIGEKASFATWKHSDQPDWFILRDNSEQRC